VQHIEIGEFTDEEAFQTFMKLFKQHSLTLGIHSPLYRNQSKNDLLQGSPIEIERAWSQLEGEAKRLSALGAQYVLIHFPFFKSELSPEEANESIKQGLVRIRQIQQQYSIPIVCEPKLGFNRSTAGINYFHHSPAELWEGIGICLDLGDFLIAAGDRLPDYLHKWRSLIKIVHLHNVEFTADNKYWWIPVHPSHEVDGVHYRIEGILRYLAESPDITFVFEHTPQIQASEKFIQEGCQWVQSIIKGRMNRSILHAYKEEDLQ
jgi:sugar phosphate isomerase/epimerase